MIGVLLVAVVVAMVVLLLLLLLVVVVAERVVLCWIPNRVPRRPRPRSCCSVQLVARLARVQRMR